MKKFDIRLFLILLPFGISSAESSTCEKNNKALLAEEDLSREVAESLTSSEVCQEPVSCPDPETLDPTSYDISNIIRYSWERFWNKFKHWTWHDTVIVMLICCVSDGSTLSLYYSIRFIRQRYKIIKERKSLERIRLQRKNRAFKTKDESEEEPERKRLLLAEPELKPWLLKLKKKRHEERLEIISSISKYGEERMQ